MATNNATNTSNPITVGQGGTGTTTFASNGVLFGSGSSAIGVTSAATTGQLLLGTTSSAPTWGNSSDGDFTFTTSGGSVGRTLNITCPFNTSTSGTSLLNMSVGGTSGGRVTIRYACGSTRSYAQGLDTQDADLPWKLCTAAGSSAGLGNTLLMQVGSAGSVTKPLNPCASVYLNTGLTNATGDGTQIAPVIFDTKSVDQQNNYSTSTGLFTVPTTGNYLVTYYITFNNLGASHTGGALTLVRDGATLLYRSSFNPTAFDDGGNVTVHYSVIVPCTAAQTLSVWAGVGGSTKTVGLQGVATGIYCNASFTLIN